MTDILMPALSPTMEEGKLAKWLVKEGDNVKPGDVIAEIETDKATMEVEAVDEGVISKIVIPEGAEGVKVNAGIAVLNGEGGRPRRRREMERRRPRRRKKRRRFAGGAVTRLPASPQLLDIGAARRGVSLSWSAKPMACGLRCSWPQVRCIFPPLAAGFGA